MFETARLLSSIKQLHLRTDVVRLLPEGAIGIELGVAEGKFSESLLKTSNFGHFYSVDMWQGDRGHDVEQYKLAMRRLLPFKTSSTVLRMRFEEAVDLFPNEYFDFIYIDGYAHTGEENGETFRQWWPKLKIGGVMAGDDYAQAWPRVIESVDKFIAEYDLEMEVLHFNKTSDIWSQFPTWVTIKPECRQHRPTANQQNLALAAEAQYLAGQISHSHSSGWHHIVIEQFDTINLGLLPSMTATKVANLYLSSTTHCGENASKLLPTSIGKAIKFSLHGGIAADADVLHKINKLTETNSDWLSCLRDFTNRNARHLEVTVSRQAEPITQASMQSLIAGIPERCWEWWSAMYARLLRLGYIEAAYQAKAIAARLLVAENGQDSSQVAAPLFFLEPKWHDFIRKAQRSDNNPDLAPEHRALVRARKVLLLTSPSYDAIDLKKIDVIARINHLPAPQKTANNPPEMLYCSLGFYWGNKLTIQTLLEEEIIAAVITLSNGEVDSLYPHKMLRPQLHQPATFLGFGYAARRAIADLLSLNAANIRISGIDFFLGKTPTTTHSLSYLLHDPLDMWRCLKALHSAGLLISDEPLSSLLELTETGFIQRIGVGPASKLLPHATTPASEK